MDPTQAAAIGGVLTALTLTVVPKAFDRLMDWLGRREEREANSRKAFQDEVTVLWTRLDRVQAECDAWREKAYQGEIAVGALKAKIELLEARLAEVAGKTGADKETE